MTVGNKVRVKFLNNELGTIIEEKKITEIDYKYKIRFDDPKYNEFDWIYESDLEHGR